jgi:hypothetical protein
LQDAYGDVYRFILAKFTLTFLVLGLLAAAFSLWRQPRPLNNATVIEALFAWFLFFSIGISFFYNFVFHTFGDMAARHIGWEDSPFQTELGWASLGYSAIGFIAFRGGLRVRAAAVVGPSCFYLGAAGVHISDMIHSHNFAPGNAGVIFYTDIAIPLIGFALLTLQYRLGKPEKKLSRPDAYSFRSASLNANVRSSLPLESKTRISPEGSTRGSEHNRLPDFSPGTFSTQKVGRSPGEMTAPSLAKPCVGFALSWGLASAICRLNQPEFPRDVFLHGAGIPAPFNFLMPPR